MKNRIAMIAFILLGLFTFSLPLYAGDAKEYHIEERTVVEIPIVGKITTETSSYLSGCKLMEKTSFKMHNSLIKMMSGSDGKSLNVQLSDMCEELQWIYDDEDEAFQSYSFEYVRGNRGDNQDDSETHIDMELDQNDMEDLPRMTHKIMGYEKNINGFKARKVLTTVYPDDLDNPIIIEEYYATKTKVLEKMNRARNNLSESLGYDENHIEGVPSMIEVIYKGMQEDQEWERPDGEVVRFVIKMQDNDGDPIFIMTYDVTTAEHIRYQEDHFSLR